MIDRIKLKYDARFMRKGHRFALMYPLIFSAVLSIISGVFAAISVENQDFSIASVIISLITSIFSTLLTYLTCAYFRNYVKNSVPDNKGYFKPLRSFKHSVKVLFADILVGIIVSIGFALLIIPGIIWALGYSQVNYVLDDKPDITIGEALRLSKMMMSGRKWEYFVFNLSFIGWFILGAFTCGILYLWLFSYIGTAQAMYYNELRANFNHFYPGTFDDGIDIYAEETIDTSSRDMFS